MSRSVSTTCWGFTCARGKCAGAISPFALTSSGCSAVSSCAKSTCSVARSVEFAIRSVCSVEFAIRRSRVSGFTIRSVRSVEFAIRSIRSVEFAIRRSRVSGFVIRWSWAIIVDAISLVSCRPFLASCPAAIEQVCAVNSPEPVIASLPFSFGGSSHTTITAATHAAATQGHTL